MKLDMKNGCKKQMKVIKLVLGSKQYCLGRMIGEGTYSKVCRAVIKTESKENNKLACKIINKCDKDYGFTKKFLPREISIIRRLSHQNIISVLDVIDIGDYVYLFMDYCANGDLLEYIRRRGALSERRSKNFFRQISSAIQYLHDLDISHRDLKCENIFLTDTKVIKVGDFGFARICHNEETNTRVLSNTFCGSAAYAAPEILQGISYYPKMYDIWSMGCILFIMLSGSMPFDDSNIKRMLKYQQNRIIFYAIQCNNELSDSLRNLLCNLLEPDVSKRINIHKVVQSEWLAKKKKLKNVS